MGWERRGGKLYYYRKVREGVRVRSIYFGSGERAETAALEDDCPHPLAAAAVRVTESLPAATLSTDNNQEVAGAPSAVDAPCATQGLGELGEVGLKKEWGAWPTLTDVIRERHSTLRSRYPPTTLPMQGESLTAWMARREQARRVAQRVSAT